MSILITVQTHTLHHIKVSNMKSERVVLLVALLLCLGVAVTVVLLLVPSLPEVVSSWSADSEFCPFAGTEEDENRNSYFEGRPRVEVHFGGVLVEWANVERRSDKCIVEYAVEYAVKGSGRAPVRKTLVSMSPCCPYYCIALYFRISCCGYCCFCQC